MPVPEPSLPGKYPSSYRLITGCAGSWRKGTSLLQKCSDCWTVEGPVCEDPRTSQWYDMHTDKKDSATSKVLYWSPDPAKLNSTFSRVARHSLPSAPASQCINMCCKSCSFCQRVSTKERCKSQLLLSPSKNKIG